MDSAITFVFIDVLYIQSMMNSCLQKPCRFGFAFVDKIPGLQVDYSGAFRYMHEVRLP